MKTLFVSAETDPRETRVAVTPADAKKLGKLGRVFATTKGLGHGLGLSRIETIVEKHDGYLSFNSEDGAFTAEILLPQE